MYEKLTKCPNFTWFLTEKLSKYPNFMTFARKINKIPEFCIIFAWKMPKFYIIIARRNFSEFWGARATSAHHLPCLCWLLHHWIHNCIYYTGCPQIQLNKFRGTILGKLWRFSQTFIYHWRFPQLTADARLVSHSHFSPTPADSVLSRRQLTHTG